MISKICARCFHEMNFMRRGDCMIEMYCQTCNSYTAYIVDEYGVFYGSNWFDGRKSYYSESES